MERSEILAHRGWFKKVNEKNSREALTRAINHGFGLETDVRDLNGRLVISHDPPVQADRLPDLSWLLEQIANSDSRGRIALNVKADGLSRAIAEMVEMMGINRDLIFVFDMSVPDGLSYLKNAIPTYSRISEYEDQPSFLDKAKGVWVDSFTGTFPQVERAEILIDKGIRAALVSPELHQRDHQPLWDAILASGLHRSPLFELCTDHPAEAAIFFCNS